MTGLEGFEHVELVVACLAGGLVIDLCLARRISPLVMLAAGSAAWWSCFFLVAELTYGIQWTVELWAGSICLAAASSALLATIVRPQLASR
jgi:dolichyl-phosphate-mannose--protein O-mannosyl transferase